MGHMKCGQPPDVRDCRPDDVAARLHTECAGWNEKDPLKRFTDENRVPVLNEVIDRGVHVCTKKGSRRDNPRNKRAPAPIRTTLGNLTEHEVRRRALHHPDIIIDVLHS